MELAECVVTGARDGAGRYDVDGATTGEAAAVIVVMGAAGSTTADLDLAADGASWNAGTELDSGADADVRFPAGAGFGFAPPTTAAITTSRTNTPPEDKRTLRTTWPFLGRDPRGWNPGGVG